MKKCSLCGTEMILNPRRGGTALSPQQALYCEACHGTGTDRYRRVCRDCEGLGIELPKSILLKRGNNSERLWTQKVLTEYSKIKGLKFQEVVWQILFVTASEMDLELQREHD